MDDDEDDNNPEHCLECDGFGVIGDFAGVYGAGDCGGPTEEKCEHCNGTGVY